MVVYLDITYLKHDSQNEEVPMGPKQPGPFSIHFYSVRVGMILVAEVHYG